MGDQTTKQGTKTMTKTRKTSHIMTSSRLAIGQEFTLNDQDDQNTTIVKPLENSHKTSEDEKQNTETQNKNKSRGKKVSVVHFSEVVIQGNDTNYEDGINIHDSNVKDLDCTKNESKGIITNSDEDILKADIKQEESVDLEHSKARRKVSNSNFSKGRKKTMRKIIHGTRLGGGHESVKSNGSEPGSHLPSIKKHDRDKLMKYLWKDLKNANITSLTTILEYDINLPDLDPTGSLLSYATRNHMIQAVEVLLLHRSPILPDEKSGGLSPIHTAVKSGNQAFIQIFLDHNVPLDIRTLYEQKTSLHIAVKAGHMDVAEMLVYDHTADPNVRDIYGGSPLHTAVTCGNSKLALFLLNHAADVNLADNEGWTPLHTAVVSASPPMVKLLLNHNALANAQTKYGKTPLHLACKCNNLSAVTLLLETEACTEIRDCHGKTAEEYTTNHDIKNLARNVSYTRCSQQAEDDPVKHISMRLRSKSLIDLIDPEYLGNHYFSTDRIYHPLIKMHNSDPESDNSSQSSDSTDAGSNLDSVTETNNNNVDDNVPSERPVNTTTFQSIVQVLMGLKKSAKSIVPPAEKPTIQKPKSCVVVNEKISRCDSIDSNCANALTEPVILPSGTMHSIIECSTDDGNTSTSDNESSVNGVGAKEHKHVKIILHQVDSDTLNIEMTDVNCNSNDKNKTDESKIHNANNGKFGPNSKQNMLNNRNFNTKSEDLATNNTEAYNQQNVVNGKGEKDSIYAAKTVMTESVVENKHVTTVCDGDVYCDSISDMSNGSSLSTLLSRHRTEGSAAAANPILNKSPSCPAMNNLTRTGGLYSHSASVDHTARLSLPATDSDQTEQDYLNQHRNIDTARLEPALSKHVDSCLSSIANISSSIDDLRFDQQQEKRDQKIEQLQEHLKLWMQQTLVIKQKLTHRT